jgi:peptidoglycan/LPS O-acetylase OafA/YrhL
LVVSLWHGQGYVYEASGWSTIMSARGLAASGAAVTTALGLVFLVSGYAIAYTYGVLAHPGAARRFLTRRVLRLYPLYVVALVLFLTFVYPDSAVAYSWKWVAAQFLCVGVLLPRSAGPPVLTLWFVQLILVYCVAYAAVMSRRTSKSRVLTLLGVIGVLLIAALVLGFCDYRVLEYTPAFVLGVWLGRLAWRPRSRLLSLFTLLAFLAAAAAFSRVFTLDSESVTAWQHVLAASMPMLALMPAWLCAAWIADRVGGRAVEMVAYASFGAYLFHRLVIIALASLWSPSSPFAAEFWLAIVGLILSFVIGYWAQRADDYTIAKLRDAISSTESRNHSP